MNVLKKEGTIYFFSEEKDMTVQSLRDNRLIFIFTELPHDDVLHKHQTFLQFLQTSCLSGINP